MVDAQSKRLNRKVHVGTMGWSYSFWKGTFYPDKLPSKEFLAYYAKHFDSVEVDSTFYRIPRASTVLDWKQQTPDGFMFSLKFPKKITHEKLLKGCQEETQVFLERAEGLEEKRGALLIQLPPMFRQQHFSQLSDFLNALPKTCRYAIEIRNKSLLTSEVYKILHDNNIALAWVDAAKMPLTKEETSDFAYVRWEGDRKAVTGSLSKVEVDKTVQIGQWAHKLQAAAKEKTVVFGYFSKYYSGYPPADAQELLKQLNR
ncbi:MAG: DUF72 domain-containing protein [Candidatus Bathyarchaeota archaeon]|nr:DUF72 domain-containing protein [Candidatus Bathyarchaeota archaeon]